MLHDIYICSILNCRKYDDVGVTFKAAGGMQILPSLKLFTKPAVHKSV